MAIPSLGDLCKSLGVNISKETPPLRAPAPATSLSTSATIADLPSTAAAGKTEREPNATVTDQSTALKQVSGGSAVRVVASSEHKREVTDAGLLQQPAPVTSAVQHKIKPHTNALSVNRGTESVSSASGVSEAKKLKSADSVGKPAVIPSSFLAAIQLQPASTEKSLVAQVGSSQPQASAASPQPLTPLPSSGTVTSLAPSTVPASIAGSAIGKNTPLQAKVTSGSSSVKASISQSQNAQKAVLNSLSSQKQSISDTATKMVSAATTTPAVATPAATKATVSRQMPTKPAANTATPPVATPTTAAAKNQQAAGSSVQIDSSATTTPKDLNLPILQFLQANFPALQLGALAAGGGAGKGEGGGGGGGGGDSSKEVLQVQTLLAHVLQQQQQLQQLQQQAQQQVQKAIASGQPLGSGTSGKTTVQ